MHIRIQRLTPFRSSYWGCYFPHILTWGRLCRETGTGRLRITACLVLPPWLGPCSMPSLHCTTMWHVYCEHAALFLIGLQYVHTYTFLLKSKIIT